MHNAYGNYVCYQERNRSSDLTAQGTTASNQTSHHLYLYNGMQRNGFNYKFRDNICGILLIRKLFLEKKKTIHALTFMHLQLKSMGKCTNSNTN